MSNVGVTKYRLPMFVCFGTRDLYKHGNPLNVCLSGTRTHMKNLNQEEPPKIMKNTEPLRFNKHGSLWPVIFFSIYKGELLETKKLPVVVFFSGRICSLNISSIPILGSHVWYLYLSRDNEVYPYQRTPMGNPYINPT